MASTPIHFLRSRGFAWTVQIALWLMLFLVTTNLGGKAPDFSAVIPSSQPPQSLSPVARLEPLFAPLAPPIAAGRLATNSANPFYTRYFVPPPSPAPPTTRKVEVTYQGFYQTESGPKSAVLKLGDNFIASRLGTAVASNYFVADASLRDMTLTNSAGQTTVLPLNVKKEIEVPVK